MHTRNKKAAVIQPAALGEKTIYLAHCQCLYQKALATPSDNAVNVLPLLSA
jgi:hypothetical protein